MLYKAWLEITWVENTWKLVKLETFVIYMFIEGVTNGRKLQPQGKVLFDESFGSSVES